MENSITSPAVYPIEDFFEFNGIQLASIPTNGGYFPVRWSERRYKWVDFTDLATFDTLKASRRHAISRIKVINEHYLSLNH